MRLLLYTGPTCKPTGKPTGPRLSQRAVRMPASLYPRVPVRSATPAPHPSRSPAAALETDPAPAPGLCFRTPGIPSLLGRTSGCGRRGAAALCWPHPARPALAALTALAALAALAAFNLIPVHADLNRPWLRRACNPQSEGRLLLRRGRGLLALGVAHTPGVPKTRRRRATARNALQAAHRSMPSWRLKAGAGDRDRPALRAARLVPGPWG